MQYEDIPKPTQWGALNLESLGEKFKSRESDKNPSANVNESLNASTSGNTMSA